MDAIFEELGIPKKYLKETSREDRYLAIVHKSWLRSLMKHLKLSEFLEKPKFDMWPDSEEELGKSWTKIFVRIFKKREAKVIPLPRIRTIPLRNDPPLLFPQLMQYISQTNFRNLWKDAYKKYNNNSDRSHTQVMLAEYNDVLREVIIRTYGCPIINICDHNSNFEPSKDFSTHSNLSPAVCCVETLNAMFLLHIPYINHSLNDCVTFSPVILEKCHAKPLFILYQLLNVLKSLHDRSLTLGDITLSDIYVNNDLWITVFPQLLSNIHVQDLPKSELRKPTGSFPDCQRSGHKFENMKCQNCGIKTYDKVHTCTESLETMCQLWIDGQISNFTYLTALNNLSGRKFGDPNCHHVFPWVTDFATRSGKTWRDLKRSKYRLNKGDRQLDLTYENTQTQVPHHVSDVLSSITYYVYMARRTPKSVLCRNIRRVWVPAEYPSSIHRMQEWTPDECIPEFFSDPTIFKSIHDDLDDLEVPPWSSSPEDFVEKHREILESVHVSERLHHWIDLTFGYKLSGSAAVKSKNVCLHLVDGHSNITGSGIVQLFTQPHPAKFSNHLFWGKVPPKIYIQKSHKNKCQDSNAFVPASITVETYKSEDELDEDATFPQSISSRSPLSLSRLLSRSRSSLNEDKETKPAGSPVMKIPQQRSSSVGPKNPTFTSHVTQKSSPNNLSAPSSMLNTGIVYLPQDYNPAQALVDLETRHCFCSKTFHPEQGRKLVTSDQFYMPTLTNIEGSTIPNAYTNLIFTETFEAGLKTSKITTKSFTFAVDDDTGKCGKSSPRKTENRVNCNYAEIIAKRHTRELQVLGCLITEIFMMKALRTLGKTNMRTPLSVTYNFEDRLKTCITVLRSCDNELPTCVKYVMRLLLQPDCMELKTFKYPSVTDVGLPPPSAHLLLEPLLNRVIPFTSNYLMLYNLLQSLKELEEIVSELDILYHFDCNGQMCLEYEGIEKDRLYLEQNIAECAVFSCSHYLQFFLKKFNPALDIEIIYILVPYIRKLIEDPPTSILACWYLFDPIAKALGPKETSKFFLGTLLKLYENEPNETTMQHNEKIVKLYHHSFLLKIMVRFGLRCFLENFVTFLIEAVGGYRDYDKVDFILHTHDEKISRKTSHLRTIDDDDTSQNEESSSSEDNESAVSMQRVTLEEQEMFDFDNDDHEPLKSLIEHLELNVESDLSMVLVTDETLVILASDDVENPIELNVNKQTQSGSVPFQENFHNIECNIGKKNNHGNHSPSDKKDYSEQILNIDTQEMQTPDTPPHEDNKLNIAVSDISANSLDWLSHSLGPVLTSRYISRNLLKMLTLCYVGKENLMLLMNGNLPGVEGVNIADSVISGDRAASKVLECLSNIAALYGEHLILLQYFPHMAELIALCKKKLTQNLEGGLVSSLVLLKHIIPYLSDQTFMDHLKDDILGSILHPCLRLLGSTRYNFPNGSISRNVLARKYIDTLYMLSLRMGADNTIKYLTEPSLQRFFLLFEKVSGKMEYFTSANVDDKNMEKTASKSVHNENYIEICRNGSFTEWVVGGTPLQISQVKIKQSDSTDSISPPVISTSTNVDIISQEMEELRSVFTANLAYAAYVPFLKQIGLESMKSSLKNYVTIHELCRQYKNEFICDQQNSSLPSSEDEELSASRLEHIGSNVALIGNRIDVQITKEFDYFNSSKLFSIVCNKMENTGRHLRGNWLAYWEHEIGRHDKDIMFNFKQIKLQTFSSHVNSVKCLYALDNENSFMSSSKDKTIKLWSLRSHGDGSNVSSCQWTYTSHKKAVLAVTLQESMRLAASSDGVVHIWDPFLGQTIRFLDGVRNIPVNTIKSVPTPSCLLLAATTEGTVRILDVRTCSYTHELKINTNAPNLIRCMAVAPSGTWLATGQSSGYITVLDIRTGQIVSMWRAHEGEVLQMVTYGENTLVSSSLDQTVSVWNVQDGKFRFHMKGLSEPVHCLNIYNNELISGTTANRIGVHTSVDSQHSFSSTKLRSDTFKGILTSMALLPMNRLLLLGSDCGNINLLC